MWLSPPFSFVWQPVTALSHGECGGRPPALCPGSGVALQREGRREAVAGLISVSRSLVGRQTGRGGGRARRAALSLGVTRVEVRPASAWAEVEKAWGWKGGERDAAWREGVASEGVA